MTDSASLKIDRAAKHVGELIELLRKKRPFRFTVSTNTKTGERSAFTKRNEAVVNEIAVISGDAVHNLRSALDHVYWEIVSPHCTTDQERRRVQFPFTSKASEVRKTILDAYGQRAGIGVFTALIRLGPHSEPGGNEMLSLVRDADNLDKHRLLIPAVEYTKVDGAAWKAELSDIRGFEVGPKATLVLGASVINWWDHNVSKDKLGSLVPGALTLYEREVNLPTEVVLQIGALGSVYPLIATLNQMVDAVRKTTSIVREAAKSY
jgi:hypothetical protein